MNRNIYFAAPLHNEEDQKRNISLAMSLRRRGFHVYLPQEHGVWENLVKEGASETEVRKYLYKLDMDAMHVCDTCIVCCSDVIHQRAPSEGAMFEMGWMKGANKTVILYNERNHWRYNLMPQFGADFVFDNWDNLLIFLDNQKEEMEECYI